MLLSLFWNFLFFCVKVCCAVAFLTFLVLCVCMFLWGISAWKESHTFTEKQIETFHTLKKHYRGEHDGETISC